MSRPTTALIIDDEVHVRVYLRMLLKQLGVSTVWEAAYADEAISLYREHKPGVVLLDLVLPGASGRHLFGQLLEEDPEVNVIVVSSQNALQVVQEMHEMGAVAYILKHTPRDQMVKMLQEALDWIGASGETES
jgi:two-component system chemotaxis response regulator CheY